MNDKKKKSNKITIYLIKDNINYDKILKKEVYENILRNDENSITYYCPSRTNKPRWLIDYFNEKNENEICTSNAKVISLHKIIIDGEEKIFAIPFGCGKYLLNDDVIEEQFGIKILLNSVSKKEFRQLITSNYGGDHRTKNEHIPKKTNIEEFGFDIYNDFLKKATAKSEEELFNKRTIVGGDLLSVSVPVTIENVNDFLKKCYTRYKSEKYKENFSWLDNIKELKEKAIIEKLNEELIKNINDKNFDKVWAAIPEIVDWELISEFKYSLNSKGFDDIDIQDIVNLFHNHEIEDVKILKKKKINAMNIDNTDISYEWSIYNCLIAEIEYCGNAYCLNYGKWYKIDDDFVKIINKYYNDIEISSIEFPQSNNEKEEKYNEKLNNQLKNSTLMDKQLVRINGMGKSTIEVCDVLTSNNELIHVKKNGGSSYLSHLFNQAAVSGEMLLDKNFRISANEKMGKIIFDDNNFNTNNYTIIMAIITKYKSERPKIPFFSKVSIKYSVEGLKRKGYTVKIKNIYNNN